MLTATSDTSGYNLLPGIIIIVIIKVFVVRLLHYERSFAGVQLQTARFAPRVDVIRTGRQALTHHVSWCKRGSFNRELSLFQFY